MLDFSGIKAISEEFAYELFVTWKNSSPDIFPDIVKASEDIENTIKRSMKKR